MFVHRLVEISRNKSFHAYILIMVFIALTLLALFLTSLRPTDVKMKSTSGSIATTLPLKEHSDLSDQETEEYNFSGIFSSSFLFQHIVNITADGCIKYLWINKVPVTRNHIIHGKNCDSTNGFDIDLGKYLHRGTNTFEIVLIDSGANDDGWLGLNIKNSYYDQIYRFLIYALILEIVMLLYFFLHKHLQLPEGIALLIVLGVLIHILYLSYTPYSVRTYDVLLYGGHFDYIKYIANHFQLPDPRNGWEYFQPPLYHITAAIVYKISGILALDYQILLQILSLVYFTIFLIFGVLILQIICKSQWLFFTSTALLAFWPSGIIHAIRIDNDLMYYMVFVIAAYFFLRWLIDKQSKHFYMASLFVALTIATKLDGLVWIGILGCLFIMLILRKGRAILKDSQFKEMHENERKISNFHQFMWLHLKKHNTASYINKLLFLASIVVLALCFSLFRNVMIALQDGHFDVLVSNISMNDKRLIVENNLRNYVYFDVNTYLTKPFTDTRADEDGRQYFWNFLLKSMLFGEFSFYPSIEQFVAIILSALLLQMIVFLLIGIFISLRKLKIYNLFLILWLILSVISVIYVRHTYPVASFEDFRYILPAIIPFIYFYLTGINFFIECKLRIIGSLGYIFAYSFIAASCIFFIIPSVS